MRAAVQRVSNAAVRIDGQTVAEIGPGLLVYLGVAAGDTDDDARYLAEKIRCLRVFRDPDGKMNLDVVQTGGSILVVSAFTLMADARQGRRPAFDAAAPPDLAQSLYDHFCDLLRPRVPVATGRFAALMHVACSNDGPIHVLLDSRRLF
jgi:D-tyrosyl-tRNA(Tyr) deacylase